MSEASECQHCGEVFERRAKHQRFCSPQCRYRARHERRKDDPSYKRRRQARANRWRRANPLTRWRARMRNTRWVRARGDHKRSPWLLKPPPLDTLPGGLTTIKLEPLRRQLRHQHLYLLHGILTALVGEDHEPNSPAWSLVPDASRCGWCVYWWRDDLAARMAGATGVAHLGGRPITASFGSLQKASAPAVQRRGRQRVEITSFTAVVSRCNGGTEFRTAPCGSTLSSTLSQKTAVGLLGTRIATEAVPITIVDRATSAMSVAMGPKLGTKRGWEGAVTVETNGLGRWLLEAVALGPGLGGWTAYGFGAVRTTSRP